MYGKRKYIHIYTHTHIRVHIHIYIKNQIPILCHKIWKMDYEMFQQLRTFTAPTSKLSSIPRSYIGWPTNSSNSSFRALWNMTLLDSWNHMHKSTKKCNYIYLIRTKLLFLSYFFNFYYEIIYYGTLSTIHLLLLNQNSFQKTHIQQWIF